MWLSPPWKVHTTLPLTVFSLFQHAALGSDENWMGIIYIIWFYLQHKCIYTLNINTWSTNGYHNTWICFSMHGCMGMDMDVESEILNTVMDIDDMMWGCCMWSLPRYSRLIKLKESTSHMCHLFNVHETSIKLALEEYNFNSFRLTWKDSSTLSMQPTQLSKMVVKG